MAYEYYCLYISLNFSVCTDDHDQYFDVPYITNNLCPTETRRGSITNTARNTSLCDWIMSGTIMLCNSLGNRENGLNIILHDFIHYDYYSYVLFCSSTTE